MILSADAGFSDQAGGGRFGARSRTALYIWIVVMGLLWPLVAVYINRKYIHGRWPLRPAERRRERDWKQSLRPRFLAGH